MTIEPKLDPARRAAMIAFLVRNARGIDPRPRLLEASDEFVELVYHKTRAVIASVPEPERRESREWLEAHGSRPISLPVSPATARSIGLVPEAGHTPAWEPGPPTFQPAGFRDMRAYLPSPMPEGWTITQHRPDGALEIDCEDGAVLVLSGARLNGKKKIIQASVGQRSGPPVDARALLRRLRGVGPFADRGSYDGLRLFTADVRARSTREDVEH